MNLVARIEAYKESKAITAGPLGPYAVAQSMPVQSRPWPSQSMLLRRARIMEHKLARGSTITAVALGLHEPLAFNRQIVKMPVFWQHAPLGLQGPRSQVIRALAMQQIAALTVAYAQMLGAGILLCQGNVAAAYRLWLPIDHQGACCSIFAIEIVLAVAVCGGFFVKDGAVAVGRRTMDAPSQCLKLTKTALSRVSATSPWP